MAQLRKITRSNPISNFRQVGPEGGVGLRAFADMANMAYEQLLPAAMEEMKQSGLEAGREMARRSIGDPKFAMPGTAREADLSGLVSGGKGFTDVTLPDGTKVRRTGSRSWRNHNPGNIEFGAFAKSHGAIGTDGRFAVFPNYEAGQRAKEALLFETSGYRDRTIDGAIRRYAPPSENNSAAYVASITSALGVSKETNLSDLTPEQRKVMLETMQRVEGWKPGQELPLGEGATVTKSERNETPPAAVVRTDTGRLEARMYHPASHPILQAHNAAAGVAFHASAMESGLVAMMDMSREFPMDPQGFQSAAKGYIDELVAKAPEQFRGDLRAGLEREAGRRALGLLEERHRDIRDRANNSSRALVERHTATLTDALLSGDPEAIAAAEGDLDAILRAREALPGIAWTPDQSENVRIGARATAERLRAQQGTARNREIGSKLGDIYAAAIAGLGHADEGILSSPEYQGHPDYDKTAAAVALRDALPDFHTLPTSQQLEELERLKSDPVRNRFDMTALDVIEKQIRENAKAWDDDPIAHSRKVLGNSVIGAPPQIENPDPENIQPFMETLRARAEYAKNLKAMGYVDTVTLFDNDEMAALTPLLGRDMDPAVRALVAGALVAGLGADAGLAFNQLGAADRVTTYGGRLMGAAFGTPYEGHTGALLAEAMRGQEIIKERGTGHIPSSATTHPMFNDAAIALAGVGGDVALTGDAMEFAKAIYAARAPMNIDPKSTEASDLFEASIQAALGQTTSNRGKVVGGVQPLLGAPTMMPIGVNAGEVGLALAEILSVRSPSRVGTVQGTAARGMAAIPRAVARLVTGESDEPAATAPPQQTADWSRMSVTGKAPMLYGQPFDGSISGGYQMQWIGGDQYHIFTNGGTPVVDEDGRLFRLKLTPLMEDYGTRTKLPTTQFGTSQYDPFDLEAIVVTP